MHELRCFIQLLRDEMDVPYPLAHHRPFVSGKHLVVRAQEESGLDPEYFLVLPVNNQMVLSYPGKSFVDRVVWEGEVAAGWRPLNDPQSSVVVRPDVRFGRPSVGGISTAAVLEEVEAGESPSDVADEFGLDPADVRWALAYENADLLGLAPVLCRRHLSRGLGRCRQQASPACERPDIVVVITTTMSGLW